jgi:hypothetical protein
VRLAAKIIKAVPKYRHAAKIEIRVLQNLKQVHGTFVLFAFAGGVRVVVVVMVVVVVVVVVVMVVASTTSRLPARAHPDTLTVITQLASMSPRIAHSLDIAMFPPYNPSIPDSPLLITPNVPPPPSSHLKTTSHAYNHCYHPPHTRTTTYHHFPRRTTLTGRRGAFALSTGSTLETTSACSLRNWGSPSTIT